MSPPPRSHSTTRSVRLMLVDDHFFVRMGLADSLSDEPDLEVVATAASGAEAIAWFRKHRPDVVLLDLQLPDREGSEVLRDIRAESPAARVLMLTVNVGEEDVLRCVESGVSGYLPKSSERRDIIRAIREVAAGREHLPPEQAKNLKPAASGPTSPHAKWRR